jgi:hypothetical protein
VSKVKTAFKRAICFNLSMGVSKVYYKISRVVWKKPFSLLAKKKMNCLL